MHSPDSGILASFPIDTAALIGLDWGTSSLRAYLLDAAGIVLASRALPHGIMHLPADGPLSTPSGSTTATSATEAAPPASAPMGSPFDRAFALACGDWLDARPTLPVLASGMIGSAQGWIEAPYVDAPADAVRLAAALARVETARGTVLRIVPGVIARGALPNVMRGEETQIIGVATAVTATTPTATATTATAATIAPSSSTTALASESTLPAAGPTAFQWVGLPGTHSKWVGVDDGRIGHFTTFMTGELYSVLVKHSILGRTMQPAEQIDIDAFLKGVDVARDAGAAGMLSTIFTTRTLGLTRALGPTQQADYLSGLLIGHELSGLAASLVAHPQGRGHTSITSTATAHGVPSIAPLSLSALATPVLIGEPALCERYRLALQHFGCETVHIVTDAGPRGLARIAVAAGLVKAPASQSTATNPPHATNATNATGVAQAHDPLVVTAPTTLHS